MRNRSTCAEKNLSYDIRTLQLRILHNLLAVDRVCHEHNLRYYIVAGSLLGAVRHGGFIPWDDDLDIAMPRPDYDLLVAHAKEWLPAPYEMICMESDLTYPFPFGKIQDTSTTLVERAHIRYTGGIYIDVFPLDGMPSARWAQRWHCMRYEFWKRIIYFMYRDPYKHGHGPSSWIPLLCQWFFTRKQVHQQLKHIATESSYDISEYVIDHDFGLRGVMRKQIYGSPTSILFEGESVQGLQQKEEYLSRIYGDYMTLPPVEKRKQHRFHFLDLEHGFRE